VNTPSARTAVRTALAVLAAAGLAYDAYAHFDLAGTYDAVKTSDLSQGDLFRVEGVVAVLAALAILVRPRRYTALIAFAVGASALGAVLIYRYYQVKSIGPIPSMYEPVWYPEKTRSAWAEAVAAAASASVFVLAWRPRERGRLLAGVDATASHPEPSESGVRPSRVLGDPTG
jgi:hypothetical protein